jgi:hypothetical protein
VLTLLIQGDNAKLDKLEEQKGPTKKEQKRKIISA